MVVLADWGIDYGGDSGERRMEVLDQGVVGKNGVKRLRGDEGWGIDVGDETCVRVLGIFIIDWVCFRCHY